MMQKKKVAHILSAMSTAYCVAMDEQSKPCLTEMLKSKMFLDPLGNYWCPEHQNRGQLLFWAVRNNYPAIQFMGSMRYAIGVPGHSDNKTSWELAIHAGREDLIMAALAHIKPLIEIEEGQW